MLPVTGNTIEKAPPKSLRMTHGLDTQYEFLLGAQGRGRCTKDLVNGLP